MLLRVQESNHSGIIEFGGLLLMVPAFANAKNLWNLLACSVLTIWCTALLCLAIRSPFNVLVCTHEEEVWLYVFHCSDTMYNEGEWSKYVFQKNSHLLCVTKFKCLDDLCIKYAGRLPKGIG